MVVLPGFERNLNGDIWYWAGRTTDDQKGTWAGYVSRNDVEYLAKSS
jgi:hypothetical protein